jgi:hypothetical protein
MPLSYTEYNGVDTAQICSSGHVITPFYNLEGNPNAVFCGGCHGKTFTQCPNCLAAIKGGSYTARQDYLTNDVTITQKDLYYSPPNYCIYCSHPFPWTVEALDAAKEFIVEASGMEELDSQIAEDLRLLGADSPRTPVAALRTKKMLSKLTKGARELAVDLIAKYATEMTMTTLKG